MGGGAVPSGCPRRTQGKVTGVSYTLLFDLVIDPAEVESITLFGQTFPLD